MADLPYFAEQLAAKAGTQIGPDELFVHLGYWDDPSRADTSQSELCAAQVRLNERMLALAQLGDGMAVLDVGCGLGGTLAAIGRRWRALRLLGLNIDGRQLAIARSAVKAGPVNHLDWLVADACAIPLCAGQLDRILAIECAFHFSSRQRFLAEAARLLRNGGRLVLSDFVASPGRASKRDAGLTALVGSIADGFGSWPQPLFALDGYLELAREVGLRPDAREDATAHVLPTFACVAGEHDAENAVGRAVGALEALVREGHLRMVLCAFEKS